MRKIGFGIISSTTEGTTTLFEKLISLLFESRRTNRFGINMFCRRGDYYFDALGIKKSISYGAGSPEVPRESDETTNGAKK